ncbi:MAG: heme-binding protein [Bacillus subtilis]|nr:heme-binding protein [Bacillus subtilis]
MSYESPRYTVLYRHGPFEIRRYEGYATSAVDQAKLPGNGSFGLLFEYISGFNDKRQKMAMTIPVINQLSEESMTMEFVVPSDFKGNAIPQPANPNVTIKQYPPHICAVYTFSGAVTKNKLSERNQRLQTFLDTLAFPPKGAIRLARYNSPFSLPPLRHNELIAQLDAPLDATF